MQTYFKTKEKDWFKNVTVFNKELYPNQEKISDFSLKSLKEMFPDGNTPKIVEVEATNSIKKILSLKISDLLDWNKINLIDITASINDSDISGVINYKINNQHTQLRF